MIVDDGIWSLQRRLVPMGVVGTLCAMTVAASATPQDAIAVEGNRRIAAETVRSYFHADSAGRYDAAALDAALKELTATGQFDDIKIERTGERVIVHVTESKVLDRVAFEGNKKVKDADLTAVVQSKPRGGVQRATVQGDVGRIVEAYHRAGRDDVRVTPQVVDRGNDRVDLVYTITEGKKTPVQAITFAGNHVFGDRQLRAIIKTSATNMLSFLTGGDVYDPDRINDDREAIRRYYQDHGYADAIVTAADAEYDPTSNGFKVNFAIDEGQLYHFGEISIVCNVPGLDANKLHGLLLARTGATFDASLLDKSSEALAGDMAKRGFPFAHAEPRIVRDARASRADIAFVIDQGARTYVERIDIHGNRRTRDYVIRREFDIAEGDAYTKTLIDRAERRLKNLNYFKTVKITPKAGSAPDRVVLDVETDDQATGDFNVSGGYSTTDGWLTEVKVGDRNFYGTGNAVQASASYGQYARGANLSVTSPYSVGRATMGAEVFDRQADVSPYQSYGSNTYGGKLSLGMPVTEQTNVLWRYSLYDQNVTLSPTASGAAVSLPIRQAVAAGPQLVSAIGDTVTINTLDKNKNPTNGFKSQLSQDLAGLGGDVKFLRTTEDTRYYQSLTRDLTGMVRAQGGYITGWGGQQAPLLNSFFGGPSMVRGFASNGFGPRDVTPGSTMDNVGGSMYWATTAELQSSIPGLPNEYGLKASAFVDAGSVFGYKGPTQSAEIANKNIVRSSVGVGMSWASPFGPLRVDYAIPLSKAASDVTQRLNFNAGGF